MKNTIYKKIRGIIKIAYYRLEDLKLIIRRRKGKISNRLFPNKNSNSYTFAMLCIKKTVYADMAIININSLLALNPKHRFILYCDTICAEYLNSRKNKLDYPNSVIIIDKYGVATKAWQYYKIEVHIEAAQNNQVDTDADGVWHADPILDRNKITMLAHAHNFIDKPNEVLTLTNLFSDKKEYLTYRHCVAAFVSMPSQFMNEKVASDMRNVNDKIFSSKLEFLATEKERGEAQRLSEEFAVNLAIQSNYSQENLVVLKAEDGWGNKNILQSLYYGCGNQVNE